MCVYMCRYMCIYLGGMIYLRAKLLDQSRYIFPALADTVFQDVLTNIYFYQECMRVPLYVVSYFLLIFGNVILLYTYMSISNNS